MTLAFAEREWCSNRRIDSEEQVASLSFNLLFPIVKEFEHPA
jgi:hypothetical protein